MSHSPHHHGHHGHHGHGTHHGTPHGPATAFGIDVGGTGIKGAPVDLRTGELLAKRVRIPTPEVSTPGAVAAVIAEIVASFDLDGDAPVGVAFPAPVHDGVVTSIANLDASWEGASLRDVVGAALDRPVHAINDADAAGYAEARYGAAAHHHGTVVTVTLGTGIGTAIMTDGHLVPNTELGHLEVDGVDAESRAAAVVREREDLSWAQWATERLQPYFDVLVRLLSPDVVVVGGGVSKHHERFLPLLDLHGVLTVPAELRNNAGIVGAAAWAAEHTVA